MQSFFFVLGAPFLASCAWSQAAQQQERSGDYGPLALAVGKDGSVHGVFAERRVGNGTTNAPQFSCLFLLAGRLNGDRGQVETWFPAEGERIRGKLQLGEQASLQLEDNHGGCLMTTGDMKNAPYELSFGERHTGWIGAGLVIANRAVLYSSPSSVPGRKRPYLVKYDPVAVLARRSRWIQVEYLEAEGKPVTGWLRDDAVGLSVPPLTRPDGAALSPHSPGRAQRS